MHYDDIYGISFGQLLGCIYFSPISISLLKNTKSPKQFAWYFLGDGRSNLACCTVEFTRTGGGAAAAEGGDAKRYEQENEHNHLSDEYTNHNP